MTSKRPKEAPRDEHLGDTRAQVRFILWLVGPVFVLGLLLFLFGGPLLGDVVGVILLSASGAALAFYAVTVLMRATVVNPTASLAGKLVLPSGSSTPPAKGLSHIEAMVARGDVAKAVEAYRAEILSDPTDVGSCERLATLAQREIKDYELAAWAYRQAEQRAETPGRKFGFGLLVAGIFRDNLKDHGRTVVELRRLVQQYPDAPRLDSLRAEIEELKAGLFDEHAG